MAALSDKVIVLRGEGMGQGHDGLGQTLMGNFLRLLLDQPDKPRAIFCYNAAVKLLSGDSPVLGHLQALAGRGVPVQACQTCVDFFGLRDALQVGELSTMAQLIDYCQECEIVTL